MKCSGCGKEIERAASGYGSNFGGDKVFCDDCTDNHPDGVMQRMKRAMTLRMPESVKDKLRRPGAVAEWKGLSESGLKCGILGCDNQEELKPCPHGCGNHYCGDHQKAHFHVIDPKTGKVDPGPRLDRTGN